MLNLFVPAAPIEALAPVRGLSFAPHGEVQADFGSLFARKGTILVGYGPQGCLCGFADWDALYQVARDAMDRHALTEVVVMRFWSGDRYPRVDRIVDLEDLPLAPPEHGEITHLRILPAEQRRHRDLVRALAQHVGSLVTLRTRSGRLMRGTLEAFDPESDVGSIDGQPFVGWNVLEVFTAGEA